MTLFFYWWAGLTSPAGHIWPGDLEFDKCTLTLSFSTIEITQFSKNSNVCSCLNDTFCPPFFFLFVFPRLAGCHNHQAHNSEGGKFTYFFAGRRKSVSHVLNHFPNQHSVSVWRSWPVGQTPPILLQFYSWFISWGNFQPERLSVLWFYGCREAA